ncbi:MAG: endonuclease/exonuclease/phosphatase family protein [Alistipes sp.]|nr:endonuclease/exonuclease/phosphatase family protein [Alistipes sp.]
MLLGLMAVIMIAAISPCVAQQRYGVMFYNVENLFDTINDVGVADEDMLPKADRAWTEERYQRKLNGVARVIADLSNEGGFPAIVALAEVENRRVLDDLVSQKEIANAQYSVCHSDSPDERGIDVAMLFRPDVFVYEGSCAVKANVESAPNLQTRDYLLVWGEMGGSDVMFCVVHFPSRIGGVKQTEHLRIGCAKQVREMVDSVMRANPDRRVVVLGDMNDNPNNRSIRKVLGAKRVGCRFESGRLYNLTASGRAGSSVYDGRWNRYDNIVVSSNLLLSGNGLHVVMPKRNVRVGYVQRFEYLLDDRKYPKPTYQGGEYRGGVSDHLPIYMELER